MLVLAAAGMAAAAPARAQEGSEDRRDQQARAHFQSGTLYFDRGEYEDAAREFEAAYELSGRSALLYNIYLARERLGDFERAADTLAKFLEDADEVSNRDSLEARLERLRERVREDRASEPPEPEAQGAPEGDAGGELLPLPAWIAFGVGAAGLVTFAVAGGMALGEDSDLAGSCGADAGRTCTAAQVKRLDRLTTTADVGLALGLAGAATGLLLMFILDADGDERSPSTAAAPWFGPDGAGATARIRF